MRCRASAGGNFLCVPQHLRVAMFFKPAEPPLAMPTEGWGRTDCPASVSFLESNFQKSSFEASSPVRNLLI